MRLSQNHIAIAAALLLCPAATGFAAAQQNPADFYKNRNVDEYIGYSTGGAYDFYARVIGRHMGAHIPGNPTFVPQQHGRRRHPSPRQLALSRRAAGRLGRSPPSAAASPSIRC